MKVVTVLALFFAAMLTIVLDASVLVMTAFVYWTHGSPAADGWFGASVAIGIGSIVFWAVVGGVAYIDGWD